MRSASSTADLKLLSGFSSGVSRITALPRSKPRRHWSGRGSGVYGTAVGDGGSLLCATASRGETENWYQELHWPVPPAQMFKV